MGGDKSTNAHPLTRPVLGDVSNRLGKKGLLIIHSQPGRKFRDGVGHNNVDDKNNDLHFVNKLCQNVEDVVKERCGFKRNIDHNNKGKRACIATPISIEKPEISKLPFVAKEGFTDNLVLSQEGSVGFPIIPTSQDSNTPALERCTLVNEKCLVLQPNIDMFRTCSCSFCVKAAYIWSDLMYMDVKGRISAIQKSQKEAANILAKRNRTNTKGSDILHGSKSSVKCSKLESDLTGQWRSLFHSMEKSLASESNQLESSLVEFKDLREDCKTNLKEIINAIPVRKQ
ncbi:uncharacterized protein LOC124921758 [Impatiens glandulifera]|uniref:uncharacterized protein LOC124921758 n=1 Tax=Impatiens glandulifera TaxID=253017 RepID=UPI001FB098FE|nr:uncharacterized protein LOC124921758 [Impatiens glandulifera]XP_047318415.1 uncharacterized protein LOC124921758 [Impatiens glandulifera]